MGVLPAGDTEESFVPRGTSIDSFEGLAGWMPQSFVIEPLVGLLELCSSCVWIGLSQSGKRKGDIVSFKSCSRFKQVDGGEELWAFRV